ncbi:MAG: 1,4-beta-xylanase [Mucilaginibacter sp.]|uniref:glycoside hydrolase family 43 protein n=1 Tax=Mucilaginibacter sp. TaxID=1882438 RepID=UPI0026237C5D|nr:glycoside hydrolase family 43 protein [Mucilaginibacter sp.]MDB5003622.1 1,4-beta-xylanase [Mucilaginibacter sp.]
MKNILSKLAVLILLIASLQSVNAQTKETLGTGKAWMLTYFRQRYPTRIEINAKGETVEVPLPNPMLVAQLHIALSTDGRHWTPINDNKPIWDQRMRDQFIHRGPDGLWRLVATGGGGRGEGRQFGPACLYATSPDLIHWKFEQSLHLMKDVKDESDAFVRNIWAPEYFYDEATKEYTLLWSSSFEDAGWKHSRLWYCKTTDWKTFTPAKVLLAPGYSCIDGTLIKQGDTYYLFHKEEEFSPATGERRGIRLATSKNLEGPYTVFDGPLNKGQIAPTITEGPSVMKDPIKPGWLLYYDFPMADQYGISSSPDLFHWTIEKDITLPSDARHGSVSQLTAAEAKALMDAYPNTK